MITRCYRLGGHLRYVSLISLASAEINFDLCKLILTEIGIFEQAWDPPAFDVRIWIEVWISSHIVNIAFKLDLNCDFPHLALASELSSDLSSNLYLRLNFTKTFKSVYTIWKFLHHVFQTVRIATVYQSSDSTVPSSDWTWQSGLVDVRGGESDNMAGRQNCACTRFPQNHRTQ